MPFTKWRAMVVASASGMGNASGHFIAVSAFGLLQRAQYVDAYSLERVTNGLYLHWRACFCLGCFSRGARVTRAAPIFYIFSLLRPVEPLADLLQAFSHPQVSTSRMVMNQVQNLRDACAWYHGKHRFLVRAQRFPFSGEDSISHLHPSPLGPQAFKYSAPLRCLVWPTVRAQPLYHLLNLGVIFLPLFDHVLPPQLMAFNKMA
ncbi:hypothetical protein T12_12703 [Trichinella patagoniensis]|uniref:Uncharacterized protein n=1 Tax=Trichinella patagoniensis TaxID=990121 RepID=A0A0V0Z2R8_9BILA|nr:hypothetical protein T12_12703 [Trichinella patagoniensis]